MESKRSFNPRISENSADDLRYDLFNSERTIARVISQLETQSEKNLSDSEECSSLSSELVRMINRWRRTASMAVEAENLISMKFRQEDEKLSAAEEELKSKEDRLQKLWEESRIIKTAIDMLEQKFVPEN